MTNRTLMSLKKLSRNNSEAEVKDLGMSGAALSTQDTADKNSNLLKQFQAEAYEVCQGDGKEKEEVKTTTPSSLSLKPVEDILFWSLSVALRSFFFMSQFRPCYLLVRNCKVQREMSDMFPRFQSFALYLLPDFWTQFVTRKYFSK